MSTDTKTLKQAINTVSDWLADQYDVIETLIGDVHDKVQDNLQALYDLLDEVDEPKPDVTKFDAHVKRSQDAFSKAFEQALRAERAKAAGRGLSDLNFQDRAR